MTTFYPRRGTRLHGRTHEQWLRAEGLLADTPGKRLIVSKRDKCPVCGSALVGSSPPRYWHCPNGHTRLMSDDPPPELLAPIQRAQLLAESFPHGISSARFAGFRGWRINEGGTYFTRIDESRKSLASVQRILTKAKEDHQLVIAAIGNEGRIGLFRPATTPDALGEHDNG